MLRSTKIFDVKIRMDHRKKIPRYVRIVYESVDEFTPMHMCLLL